MSNAILGTVGFAWSGFQDPCSFSAELDSGPQCPLMIHNFTGSPVSSVQGHFRTVVQFEGRSCLVEIYVQDNMCAPVIGRVLLSRPNIHVDIGTMQVQLALQGQCSLEWDHPVPRLWFRHILLRIWRAGFPCLHRALSHQQFYGTKPSPDVDRNRHISKAFKDCIQLASDEVPVAVKHSQRHTQLRRRLQMWQISWMSRASGRKLTKGIEHTPWSCQLNQMAWFESLWTCPR